MIGETLGHYRIVERLGKGGMGEVYVAEDAKLGRHVALKILPGDLAADADRRARFEQEARTVAALNHPNIVTLHSIEEEDGVHFLTMELVRGRPLSEEIPKQGLSLARLLRLAVPIADAVAAAHQRGITHRDLKPDNIVLSEDGVPKVLDFGLAKLTGGPEEAVSGSLAATVVQTAEGKVFGTLVYMSPEQAQGQPADHRSDVFSLGIVLYEMATGVRPFQGDTGASIMASILKDEPRSVTDLNRALPRQLGRIIRMCLAKDPTRRYQSAVDLRNQLEGLQHEMASGELTPAQPEGRVPGTRARRGSFLLAAAGILSLSAAAVVVTWVLLGRSAVREPAMPGLGAARPLTEYPGSERFPSLSPDGGFVAYEGQAEGEADIYLLRIGGRNPINLTPDAPGDDEQPAFSPDGEQIAFHSDREGGGLFVMGATGESVRRLTDFGYHPSWSPDGKRIVFCNEKIRTPIGRQAVSQIWAVDVASGKTERLSTEDAVQPVYSPGGLRIAYWTVHAGGRRDVRTIPAGGGEPVTVTDDAAMDWNPVWAPDGKHLYFASDRGGSMSLWRIAIDEPSGRPLGEPEPLTTGGGDLQGFLSAGAGGTKLAYAVQRTDGQILRVAFDPEAGEVRGEPAPIAGLPRSLVYAAPSSDGGRLVLSNFGAKQEDIFVANADGSGLRQLTDDPFKDRSPRWMPDDERIVFYSGRSGSYEIWSIRADGSDLRQLTDTPELDAIWQVLSPDGTRLLYQDTFDHAAWIVRLDLPFQDQKPELLDRLITDEGWLAPWSWSPDGTQLAGSFLDASGQRGGLGTYDLETGELRSYGESGRDPDWLPDGRRVLFADDGGLRLLDTATGESRPVDLRTGRPFRASSVILSRDGRTLYVGMVRLEADLWMLDLGSVDGDTEG